MGQRSTHFAQASAIGCGFMTGRSGLSRRRCALAKRWHGNEVGGRFPVISGWVGKLNLQKRSLTMTRRVPFLSALFPLVPLLAVVLVGFAQGQSAVEHE